MSDRKYQCLIDWASTFAGTYFHPSLIVKNGKVLTTKVLPPDTVLVSCPPQLVISPSSVRKSLSQSFPVNDVSTHALLCAFICQEFMLGKDGFAWPYWNSLPEPGGFDTPLWWMDDELQWLHGTSVYHATLERKRIWKEEWEVVKNFIEVRNERPDLERYYWAATILSSRCFPSILLEDLQEGQNSHPILLPLIDMFNHKCPNPITWSKDSSAQTQARTISLIAHSGYAAGEEVFNNYGAKSNEELLMGYGFTTPSNDFDSLTLVLNKLDTFTLSFSNVIPHSLFKVSSQLCRNAREIWYKRDPGFRAQILGIHNVGEALTERLHRQVLPIQGSGRRWDLATAYIHGQRNILRKAIKKAKKLERKLIQQRIAEAAASGNHLGDWDFDIGTVRRILTFTNPEFKYVRDCIFGSLDLIASNTEIENLNHSGQIKLLSVAIGVLTHFSKNVTVDWPDWLPSKIWLASMSKFWTDADEPISEDWGDMKEALQETWGGRFLELGKAILDQEGLELEKPYGWRIIIPPRPGWHLTPENYQDVLRWREHPDWDGEVEIWLSDGKEGGYWHRGASKTMPLDWLEGEVRMILRDGTIGYTWHSDEFLVGNSAVNVE